DEYSRFVDRCVGYAKVTGEWGLAIRRRDGLDEEFDTEKWRFGDAPRQYRLEAVDKLPELLEGLLEQAAEATQEIQRKVEATRQIAEVLTDSPDLRAQLLRAMETRDPEFVKSHNVARRGCLVVEGHDVSFVFSSTMAYDAFLPRADWIKA